jgi:hypothetical protein
MQPRTASCSCGRANTRISSGAAPVYQEKKEKRKIEQYKALVCGLTKPYRAEAPVYKKKRKNIRAHRAKLWYILSCISVY